MNEVKKAIIPVAGVGTRFLPLSKIVPKEVWPLVDKPVLQYIVQEAKNSGIEEIVFVISSKKSIILDYFKESKTLEKLLKKRGREYLLKEMEEIKEIIKDISFSVVLQKKPLGDGHAVLQAAQKALKQPCAVMFGDDVVESQIPCIAQLINIYKTSQRPVIALARVPKDKLSSYGVVEVEKIAKRVFKIRRIVEKPEPEKAPSNLAIVGKYIITPEVFDYLKKGKLNKKGELILANVFNKMLLDGKTIYGYEFDGKWLECGTKLDWLKTHLYLSLKDPRFGPELKKFLKEIR
jgi:UTP--glucose-1-phosphate uridylyltransferase